VTVFEHSNRFGKQRTGFFDIPRRLAAPDDGQDNDNDEPDLTSCPELARTLIGGSPLDRARRDKRASDSSSALTNVTGTPLGQRQCIKPLFFHGTNPEFRNLGRRELLGGRSWTAPVGASVTNSP
jgi:hypothetical protein